MNPHPDDIEAAARAILKVEFYDIEPEMYFNLTDFYESVWPDYGPGALARALATILAYEASKKEREGRNDDA